MIIMASLEQWYKRGDSSQLSEEDSTLVVLFLSASGDGGNARYVGRE